MKYKRKLAPATTFDFAAMETWLSDMAEDGWIPVAFQGDRVKFRQDEPQKRIFRIAIPDFYNDTPSEKQKEAYRQLGWEYLCGYRCKGYLLANIAEHPEEPYTDPVVQQKNIDALYREERYLYLAGVILFTLAFLRDRAAWVAQSGAAHHRPRLVFRFPDADCLFLPCCLLFL